jgi:hypothetical protein
MKIKSNTQKEQQNMKRIATQNIREGEVSLYALKYRGKCGNTCDECPYLQFEFPAF